MQSGRSQGKHFMEATPIAGTWLGDFHNDAPPPFMVAGNLAVPIEATKLDVVFEANASAQRASGRGRIQFTVGQSGRPLLDLVPHPSHLVLNGTVLPPERLRLVLPPDESTPLRMLDEPLSAGEHYALDVEYPLANSTVQFGSGGIRLGLFMTDLDQRGYLERHAPANLEFDQLAITIEV